MIAAVCYSIWNHASRAADVVSAANASDAAFGDDIGAAVASGFAARAENDASTASRASCSASYDSASDVSEYVLALGASDPRSKR